MAKSLQKSAVTTTTTPAMKIATEKALNQRSVLQIGNSGPGFGVMINNKLIQPQTMQPKKTERMMVVVKKRVKEAAKPETKCD